MVLARPKFRRWVSVADATALVEALAAQADIHPDPVLALARTRDAKDDHLVALAEAAPAVIVTGDADLLDADLSPAAITPRTLLTIIG